MAMVKSEKKRSKVSRTATQAIVESRWKQKARAMFPYASPILHMLDDESTTVYTLLYELLSMCLTASHSGCEWELQRIFDYAEWCWRQDTVGTVDLANAAGVAFYEHVRDYLSTEQIRRYVKLDLFEEMQELFVDTFDNRNSGVDHTASGCPD